ncbi:hypothetical protein B0T22DRAFT_480483 [Podospora appendiculata]|uniref:DUF7907 domain-containing protein n=1 Tax=Podospora appendiculata TaxID=314037 RepID=A0AAE0XAS1_9PEZI|nr:hypothetical protein B0T22DRAFT_480483 [Podospora appendiculata]
MDQGVWDHPREAAVNTKWNDSAWPREAEGEYSGRRARLIRATPTTTLSPRHFSSYCWTQAFNLIANVTNPSLDLTPSINHFQLTGIHIGAGLSTAVLTPTTGRVLYENGTGTTPQTTGIASDLGGIYPYSLTITPLPADEPDAAYVDYVGIDIGTAQDGIGVGGDGGEWPVLSGPDRGTFVVCYEPQPAYGRPQYPVRFARERVVGGVAVLRLARSSPGRCIIMIL